MSCRLIKDEKAKEARAIDWHFTNRAKVTINGQITLSSTAYRL